MATTRTFRADEDERLVQEDPRGKVLLVIEGNKMLVDLTTIHGRMAARMLAYSLAATDPGLARAILSRVGQEG